MAPELITAKIPLITAACAGFKDLARTYPRTYARNSRSGGVSSVSLRSRREASFAPRARCTRIRSPFPPPPLLPSRDRKTSLISRCVYTARREIFPRSGVSAGQRSENSPSPLCPLSLSRPSLPPGASRE